ncbi:unnamed protein product, partial [Urochloa humidicola]
LALSPPHSYPSPLSLSLPCAPALRRLLPASLPRPALHPRPARSGVESTRLVHTGRRSMGARRWTSPPPSALPAAPPPPSRVPRSKEPEVAHHDADSSDVWSGGGSSIGEERLRADGDPLLTHNIYAHELPGSSGRCSPGMILTTNKHVAPFGNLACCFLCSNFINSELLAWRSACYGVLACFCSVMKSNRISAWGTFPIVVQATLRLRFGEALKENELDALY